MSASPNLLRRFLQGVCAVLASSLAAIACAAAAPNALTLPDELAEAEAFALGYQAYVVGAVYARSQILMEKDIHPGATLNAPLNSFNVYPGLATPGAAIDFTPNNDTVYGLAWLDLSQGPVLMTIPEVKGRYYTIQATDWALNTFAYVGSRLNSKPSTYAYLPPGWKGELPAGVIPLQSTTNGVFLQARTVVKPEVEADIAPVVAQLKTYTLQPLNPDARYLQADPASAVPNPKMNNPLWQSLDFYTLLNRAWAFGGVREQDQEVVAQFAALGIGPGLTFDPAKLTAAQRKGLEHAVKVGFQRVPFHARENGELRNGWRFATNIGDYGSNRLFASTVAMVGYGGNKAEEALYLPVFTDQHGEQLQSDRRYRIHFAADNLPPVEAFWSVTLYRLPDNQLKANPINRYAFGDRTPTLKHGADGSVDIYIQAAKPAGEQAANWLPTGEPGPFWMILRMYQPAPKTLAGEYYPSAVERLAD